MSDCIENKFRRFHDNHPEVYEHFKKFTGQVMRSGYKNYGAKSIFERIRWHMQIERGANDEFKINNNFTSRYVRLFEKEYPEYSGFFKTRKLKS